MPFMTAPGMHEGQVPSSGSYRSWKELATGLALAALVLSAAPPSRGGVGPPDAGTEADDLRSELEALRADLAELLRRNDELLRRMGSAHGPVRAAVEDYLEARGVTGLALTDGDLRPLDRILRRATFGADLRLRYERWDNLIDLDDGRKDTVDFSETRARLAFGYALVGGPELEFELQGLTRQEGLFELPPLAQFGLPRPPGTDPVARLDGEAEFAFRRAEVRLPAFNLLGRLAHVPVTLVAGRQEIALGDGFLLGRDDAGNGIAWDGVRLYAESGSGGRVDLFAARASAGAHTVASRIGGPVDPASDPAIEIAGVRGEAKGLLPDTRFAAYLVTAQASGITSADPLYVDLPLIEVSTFGLEADLDLTSRATVRLDGAVQWGRYYPQSISGAVAAAAALDLAAPEGGGIGLSLFAAYGSGDRGTAGAGDFEGFIPLAQDVRGRWDEAGLLSSRNAALWGVRLVFTGRAGGGGFEAGLRITHARAPEDESPTGLFMAGSATGPGKEIGDVVSLFAEWPLFDTGPFEEGSRLRVGWTYFDPGDYFASPADPAGLFCVEMRIAF